MLGKEEPLEVICSYMWVSCSRDSVTGLKHVEVTKSEWHSLYISCTWAVPKEPSLGKSLEADSDWRKMCVTEEAGNNEQLFFFSLFFLLVCFSWRQYLCGWKEEVYRWLYPLPKVSSDLGNWLIVSYATGLHEGRDFHACVCRCSAANYFTKERSVRRGKRVSWNCQF